MSLNNHIKYRSAGENQTLSTRASSVTLSVSQHLFDTDGATENVDMTIAQGLLDTDNVRIPNKRLSFSNSTTTNQDDQERSRVSGPLNTVGQKRRSRFDATSNTWTSSEGDKSDYGENEDRKAFADEYNRLAEKYGIAFIVPDDFVPVSLDKVTIVAKQGNWIMRKLLKRTGSIHTMKHKVDKPVLRHKRSVSDLTIRLKARKDPLKDKSLQELVRLCGASALYLPSEYAAGTLAVPTCFRATAQYLVQHAASTRGIFRIPGAHSKVMALYNHYATEDEHGDVISGTVRCPTLPEHIKCDVHDVASAFKKFLSGLPGGILGKAWLFEAFLAIDDQLDAAPEWTRTKKSRLRARLIALAIASTVPRYQRELICAVFGLLSMIGRAAETSRREDEHGRPLPTAGLMGYGSLGVVFGPLLVGEILDSHDLNPGTSNDTLHLTPKSPKSFKGRNKKSSKKSDDTSTLMREGTEKVRRANKITEMLITHWRDVVRHMKNLGALRTTREYQSLATEFPRPYLRPSASEPFMIRKPPQWAPTGGTILQPERYMSPSPTPRYIQRSVLTATQGRELLIKDDILSVQKQRSRPRSFSTQILSGARSMSILAPTVEESQTVEERETSTPSVAINGKLQDQGCSQPLKAENDARTERYRPAHSSLIHKSEFIPRANGQIYPVSYNPTAPLCIQDGNPVVIHVSRNPRDLVKEKGAELSESTDDFLGAQLGSQPELIVSGSSDAPKALLDTSDGNELTSRSLSVEPYHPRMNTPKMKLKFQTEKNTKHKTPLPGPSKLPSSNQLQKGIVSNRLRDIAASDPAKISSGFQDFYVAPNRDIERPRGEEAFGTSPSLVFSRSIKKDPLSRVSQEDDMASLAALGEVIDSPGQVVTLRSDPANSVVNDNHSGMVSMKLSSKGHYSHTGRSNGCEDESCSRKRASEDDEIGFPAIQPFGPVTPRRTLISTQSGGSVKALAAKFNNVELAASPASSPTKAPRYRHGTRSMFEESVISRYTSNSPSPTRSPQWSIRFGKSDRSSKSIRDCLPSDEISEPIKIIRLPESSNSVEELMPNLNTDGARDSKSLCYHSFHNIAVDKEDFTDATVRWRGNSATSMIQLGHNGNHNSVAHKIVHKRSSLGRVLPRPDEPLVDQSVNFTRPSSMPTVVKYHDSASPNKFLINETVSLTSVEPGSSQYHLRRGSSLLYSQVQHLQRQLRARSDEAEQLRRQLQTKECINELCTLSEELRQTKRELISWKKRAEIAERGLQVFSMLEPKDASRGDIAGMVSAGDGNRENTNMIPAAVLAGKVFHIQNKKSNDTARRSRAKSTTSSWHSSSEFDDMRETLSAYEKAAYKLEQ